MNNFVRKIQKGVFYPMMITIVAGCSTFSEDGGFDAVQAVADKHLEKELQWVRKPGQDSESMSKIKQLLAEPLTADSAIQIALLNNVGLQADYQELGISEAAVVQAGTLPNPGFSFGKYRRGDEREIERGYHFNLAKLLFMPLLKGMASRQFEQTQSQVAGKVLTLASETRKAFYQAVAAKQRLGYMEKVKKTADTGATLARRMARIGNLTRVQQAREQGFYADAVVNLIRARQSNFSAREKLIRLMGLWGRQLDFELPERLSDLPDSPQELDNAEQTAMSQRLDIQGARIAIDRSAKNLKLTKISRFVNVLEVGYERETSNEDLPRTGYELGFEIPLFDWSGSKTRVAESQYMQTVHRAAEMAINARSEVRDAYFGYRSAYDIARLYRDEIVPAKKRVSEENLYRYNGMIIGVFELLADARSQVAAVDGYIQALHDYWIADTDLQMAMLGKPDISAMRGAAMNTESADAGH